MAKRPALVAMRFDTPIGLASIRRQFRVPFPPFPPPLDWHSTSVSFRDFRAGSRNGKPDESFSFHDRKEGGEYGLPGFDEDTRDSRDRPLNFPFNLGIHDSHPDSCYLSDAAKRVYIGADHSPGKVRMYVSRYLRCSKALRKDYLYTLYFT